ncbi:hypothetical protein ACFL2V_13115 [Pseudomonadota bacterium]
MSMNKNSNLQTLLLCAVFSLSVAACNTQNTPEPEVTDTNDTQKITEKRPDDTNISVDIDNDGNKDFEFVYESIATSDVPSSGGGTSLFLAVINTDANLALNGDDGYFEKSVQVEHSLEWEQYGRGYLTHIGWSRSEGSDSQWNGPWAGAENKYIAVNLRLNGVTHFGWLEISVDVEDASVTLHDHYLHPVAEQVAFTGEKELTDSELP